MLLKDLGLKLPVEELFNAVQKQLTIPELSMFSRLIHAKLVTGAETYVLQDEIDLLIRCQEMLDNLPRV